MFESIFTSDWLLTFDMKVYQFAEKLFAGSKTFETIMIFFTHLGDDGIFWIALALVLLLFKKTRKIGIAMAASLAIVAGLNNLVFKPFFNRPRPYIMDEANWLRVAVDGWKYNMPFEYLKEDSVSFPSGHTASSFAAAIGIFYVDKKKGIIPLIIAAIIGYSRIYIHVHYPSDVIAGAVFGTVLGLLACVIVFKVFGKPLDKLNKKTGYRLLPAEGEGSAPPAEDSGDGEVEISEESELYTKDTDSSEKEE